MNDGWQVLLWTYERVRKEYPDLLNEFAAQISTVALTDLIALQVVADYGGVHLDIDSIPIRPLPEEFLSEAHVMREVTKGNPLCIEESCGSRLGSLIMAPKGHPMVVAAVSDAYNSSRKYVAEKNKTGESLTPERSTIPTLLAKYVGATDVLPEWMIYRCNRAHPEICQGIRVAAEWANGAVVPL